MSFDPAGLVPQPELAVLDVAGHALGGRADQRELEVVDRARAVHRDVGDEAAFHQVDDEAREPDLDHVRAHQQDHRRAVRARWTIRSAMLRQRGIIER